MVKHYTEKEMIRKEEIFAVAFNRTIVADGTMKVMEYEVEKPSPFNVEIIVEKIELKEDRVIVKFSDGARYDRAYRDTEVYWRKIEDNGKDRKRKTVKKGT